MSGQLRWVDLDWKFFIFWHSITGVVLQTLRTNLLYQVIRKEWTGIKLKHIKAILEALSKSEQKRHLGMFQDRFHLFKQTIFWSKENNNFKEISDQSTAARLLECFSMLFSTLLLGLPPKRHPLSLELATKWHWRPHCSFSSEKEEEFQAVLWSPVKAHCFDFLWYLAKTQKMKILENW